MAGGLLKSFVIAGALSLTLTPGASTAFAQGTGVAPVDAPPVAKAACGAGDHTEKGLQGQTTPEERASGNSEKAYNCNLELVGQLRGEGAVEQNGPAYFEECAYFATANNPEQKHHGVWVVDVSDPANPKVTTYLDDTPTMLESHKSLRVSERRKLLAGVQFKGPNFAVYDVSDCRRPALLSSIDLPGSVGHMGNFAPDGRTYYVGQDFRGVGGWLHVVDLDDPRDPLELRPWQFTGDGRPHGIWLSADGTRLYAGQPGEFARPEDDTLFGPDGLVIDDVSDYQFRRRNPQVRIVSKVFWDDQGQVEEMRPITIKGRPYLISSDETGGLGGAGLEAACVRGASPFGYPNIIDITDETNPRIVASLKLEVSDAANCDKVLSDPPYLGGGIPNYSNERCVPDRDSDPKMLACSFQHAGLRIFDIRDLTQPREIAYYKPGAMRKAFLPGAGYWRPDVDMTVDRTAGYARFYKRDNGDLEIWMVSDENGFQVLRFSDGFKAANEDLFED